MKNIFILVTFFLTNSLFSQSEQAILSGGEMTCEYLYPVGTNKVKYKININEDWLLCPTSPFSSSFIFLSVYEEENNTFNFLSSTVIIDNESLLDIEIPNFACQLENDYCRKRGEHSKNFILPLENPIYIVTQKCCRDTNIINLSSSNSLNSFTGITLYALLQPEALELHNTNPSSTFLLPPTTCLGQNFSYDLSANDVDNDSLSYEFAPIFNGAGNIPSLGDCNSPLPMPPCPPPFSSPQYISPYSTDSPLGQGVTLNPTTGELQGIIEEEGVFAFGIAIKEYRNGIFIAETYREHHIQVAYCADEITAAVIGDSNDNNTFFIESCNNLSVQIQNVSTDTIFVEGWYYEFEIDGMTEVFSDWSPLIDFPATGRYSGILVLNPNQSCTDTAFIELSVSQDLQADFSYQYDTCVANPILFTNLSVAPYSETENYHWDFGNGDTSTNISANYEYSQSGNYPVSLSITDESTCSDTIETNISYFPVPPIFIVELDEQAGCPPFEVEFNNTTPFIDSNYVFYWDFGDNTFSTDQNPKHSYTTPNIYDVKLEIVSPFDCEAEQLFEDLITVIEAPIADFTHSPQEINSIDNHIFLTNSSLYARNYEWFINGNFIANEAETDYIFVDTGLYEVKLIAYNEYFCLDSTTTKIFNTPTVNYFFPNAFSPNGDGKNDVFKGKGSGFLEGIQDYSLKIWSRWGELLFETNDINSAWSGQNSTTNRLMPQAIYQFYAQFSLGNDNFYEFSGSILLIK